MGSAWYHDGPPASRSRRRAAKTLEKVESVTWPRLVWSSESYTILSSSSPSAAPSGKVKASAARSPPKSSLLLAVARRMLVSLRAALQPLPAALARPAGGGRGGAGDDADDALDDAVSVPASVAVSSLCASSSCCSCWRACSAAFTVAAEEFQSFQHCCRL